MCTITFPDDQHTVDVVYSLDDGGYWLHGYWLDAHTGKITDAASRWVFPTEAEAIAAAKAGHVDWE